MKSITKVLKGFFGKRVVEIETVSMADLVDKLKWAEVEVEDTKDALLGLLMRLQNGVVTMEDIIEDAQDVIDHHQAILAKATARKSEFHGHVGQITQAISVVDNLYKK